jgi:hypothetical protein
VKNITMKTCELYVFTIFFPFPVNELSKASKNHIAAMCSSLLAMINVFSATRPPPVKGRKNKEMLIFLYHFHILVAEIVILYEGLCSM